MGDERDVDNWSDVVENGVRKKTLVGSWKNCFRRYDCCKMFGLVRGMKVWEKWFINYKIISKALKVNTNSIIFVIAVYIKYLVLYNNKILLFFQ